RYGRLPAILAPPRAARSSPPQHLDHPRQRGGIDARINDDAPTIDERDLHTARRRCSSRRRQRRGLRQLRRNEHRRKFDPAILDQTAVPSCLAPREELARMHAVALRNRADARPRLQRLGDNLLLIRKAPAPPALNRDDLRPLHRPRSSPSATSRRKPSPPSMSKVPSPSGYPASPRSGRTRPGGNEPA